MTEIQEEVHKRKSPLTVVRCSLELRPAAFDKHQYKPEAQASELLRFAGSIACASGLY